MQSEIVFFTDKVTIQTSFSLQTRFHDHANNVCPVTADLRSTCYKAVLQEGDESIFNEMLNLYRATDLHEEQDRISRALGCIGNVDLLRKVIDFAMSVRCTIGIISYNSTLLYGLHLFREKFGHRIPYLSLLL